ncbi:hypothetical protein GOP47_0023277 [Adiantum capillus-veneris]|uniref:GAGA-binding transcriptional activator n=1 Tax=Adiantum capillus-veneris TaxID=13818 RepID=A0A9D4Z528_ADICA|nr:hypothetical protein GOP47_0023277 [Adiantum capillus-veneris]
MEDPAKMELRHWANFDQAYLKDFFRDQSTTKLTQVTVERDAAFAERDKALADKKIACNERDAALLQRDVAYADRNTAWVERDKAMTALTIICNNGNDPEGAAKLLQVVNFVANRAHMGNSLICLPDPVEEPNSHGEERSSQRQGKQLLKSAKKETPKKRKASVVANQEKKGTKSSRKKQKQQEGQGKAGKSKQDEVCKSIVAYVPPYDLASTPVPLCSCTGTNRQCYRWGSGGWQSSCCTTFLSVYPLPLNHSKRSSRVAGRKMSGSAFKKLLERLAGAGEDITQPIDLKNHWAKHGTNKYVTVR